MSRACREKRSIRRLAKSPLCRNLHVALRLHSADSPHSRRIEEHWEQDNNPPVCSRVHRGQTQEHAQCTRTRSPAAKISRAKI